MVSSERTSKAATLLARCALSALLAVGANACRSDTAEDEPAPEAHEEPDESQAPVLADRVVGRDGVELIRVDAGTYPYGGQPASPFEDSLERRRVAIDAVYVDELEVSVARYAACVAAGACEEPPPGDIVARTRCHWFDESRSDHPMNCVTRAEAEAYCAWVGRRLPTEPEWVAAARGQEGLHHPDGWRPPADGSSDTAAGDAGAPEPLPVRPVGARDWDLGASGVRDVLANVSEWVAGVFEGASNQRVGLVRGRPRVPVRGASHEVEPENVSFLWRFGTARDVRRDFIGFRCAVGAEDVASARCQEDGASRCEAASAERETTSWRTAERLTVVGGDVGVMLPRSVRDDRFRRLEELPVATFAIDRYEVTADRYEACAAASPCPSLDVEDPRLSCTWMQRGRGQHPINCVDFEQATAFCAAIGGRLPTELEWLRAAYGDGRTKYPWGDQAEPERANRWHPGGTEAGPDGFIFTAPVDAFPRDIAPTGVVGAAGNVSEWVSASIDPFLAPSEFDPAARAELDRTRRALRTLEQAAPEAVERHPRAMGGSWRHNLEDDGRDYAVVTRPDIVGFRCAYDIVPAGSGESVDDGSGRRPAE